MGFCKKKKEKKEKQSLKNGYTSWCESEKDIEMAPFVCTCIFIIPTRSTLWVKHAVVTQLQSSSI